MSSIFSLYDRLVGFLSGKVGESIALLITRLALAGIFWRSYKTKVEDGSWFEITDTTYFLFAEEYSGVPLPSDFAAVMATYSEFLFPILLVLGLFTRFSALALLGMTLVIQFFVYTTADFWWGTHIIWTAMAAILISRGAGLFSLDALLAKARGA